MHWPLPCSRPHRLAQTSGEPRTQTPDTTELPVTSAQQERLRALVPRDALRQATLPPGIELREIPPEVELGPIDMPSSGT